jgi:hypothetical protein
MGHLQQRCDKESKQLLEMGDETDVCWSVKAFKHDSKLKYRNARTIIVLLSRSFQAP